MGLRGDSTGRILIRAVLGLPRLWIERYGAVGVVIQVVLHCHPPVFHVNELPAGGVALQERIGPVHGHGQFGQVALCLRIALRVRPRPGGRHNRMKADVANLVVLDLVHVP